MTDTDKKTSVFGNALNKGKKSDGAAPRLNLQKIDEVAEVQGFVSREATRRRNYVGPARALNVKLPVDVYDRFIKFCDENDLSIRKGIEQLLDETGR